MATAQRRVPSIEKFPALVVKKNGEKEAAVAWQGFSPAGERRSFFESLVNAGLDKKSPEPRSARTKSGPAFVSPASARNHSSQKTHTQNPPSRQPGGATAQSVSEHQSEVDFDVDQLEIPAFLRRQAN